MITLCSHAIHKSESHAALIKIVSMGSNQNRNYHMTVSKYQNLSFISSLTITFWIYTVTVEVHVSESKSSDKGTDFIDVTVGHTN